MSMYIDMPHISLQTLEKHVRLHQLDNKTHVQLLSWHVQSTLNVRCMHMYTLNSCVVIIVAIKYRCTAPDTVLWARTLPLPTGAEQTKTRSLATIPQTPTKTLQCSLLGQHTVILCTKYYCLEYI